MLLTYLQASICSISFDVAIKEDNTTGIDFAIQDPLPSIKKDQTRDHCAASRHGEKGRGLNKHSQKIDIGHMVEVS